MDESKKWITFERVTGDPLTVGERILRPASYVLTIRWPNGGWIWQHPAGVVVEEEGVFRYLPVVDVTRQNQWLFWGLALLFLIIGITRR